MAARVIDEVTATAWTPYAEAHETHSAVVVLVGDRAYKFKKPVVTDFLDFGTVQHREIACAREVKLNSRLAPASYLGVAHISDPAGGSAEPLVVMRRYPDSNRLARMAVNGEPLQHQLNAVAAALSRFHAGAHRGPEVDEQGRVDAVTARWRANIAEMDPYVGSVVTAADVDRVSRLSTQYITGRSRLFAHRISDNRIVDGHGDLLADDIFCQPDGPVLLDCLDFDDRLRYVDGIDDAAFLAMDLEFLGRADLADYFLDQYSRLRGEDAPASLKHFYIAYRALVRAKVDCVRHAQGSAGAAKGAQRHLSLAADHLSAGAVRVTLLGGAPGTGKTTLAHALADRVDAVVISSDDVRRELQQADVIGGEPGVLDSGLYSADKVQAVYDTVLRRACGHLAHGRSVILDATWRYPGRRLRAHELAVQAHAAMVELACRSSFGVATARVRDRPPGTSDADPQIADALGRHDDEWITAHRVDTGRPLQECAEEAERLWRQAV
ncbi:AAA family ATPase [Mycobacterium sp.]|uniref:bifunctional aminoglycoside phosphotransferase/ATP-binding protein n=1 Tax=Mycobacterium sp. TaxID=1785 RepID=UPI002B5D97C8|nr:AAA family ATPase [Mycobacterium sp.]HME46726.1 AAA family ATPase [Mycobacterium sp.]